jgi:mannose-6-phosphate isomerase-like protein (cupin superfamily)
MNVIKIEECPDYLAPDNAVAKEFLSPRNSALERLSIAKITIPPRTSVEKHYHPQSEEVYQIIDGEGTMLLDQATRKVGPGEVIPIPTGSWHSIDNQSDQDLVMIVTCSPPWTSEDQVFES